MHEIICPHCSKAFKIDEAWYADILKQVRDGDIDKQLHERLELAERGKARCDCLGRGQARPCAARRFGPQRCGDLGLAGPARGR